MDGVKKLVPSMKGQLCVVSTPWYTVLNQEITMLALNLEQRYPEAGRHYWSMRAWSLSIWQPIYFMVIAVHQFQCSPSLQYFSQISGETGEPCGYRFQEKIKIKSEVSTLLVLIENAALQINQGCASLYECWKNIGPLKRKAAKRVQADCVLGALLLLHRSNKNVSVDHTLAYSQAWLSAMNLHGQSGLVSYVDKMNNQHLAMDRKICCLHHKRSGEVECMTCPRLSKEQRLDQLIASHV
ncbi:siderophore ferric iron reductase [bacterium AH-315-K03]|nr:siderophore ferric iron reductase [bacterium AH-315-K03]